MAAKSSQDEGENCTPEEHQPTWQQRLEPYWTSWVAPIAHSLSNIWHYTWLLEVLSCVLASIFFAAIVITLAIHKDQPLPKWPKAISINSLVAIFNAMLKACLLTPVAEGKSS